LPEPQDNDVPDLNEALQNALRNRPDLLQAVSDVENQNISGRFTKNAMLPQLSTFGLYAGSGLQGASLIGASSSGGLGSLNQAFGAANPEYGAGLTYFMYLGNRSAQADGMRAQLEANQSQVSLQKARQQINLEVRQAITGLLQGRSQVEAAHEAAELARRVAEAEQKKLEVGISTPYDVVLRERDLVTAQQAEIAAVSTYAKALVEMDRSSGVLLDRNNVELDDAHLGVVTHMPAPPFRIPRLPVVPSGSSR
jgi:outer membrane protein TolC